MELRYLADHRYEGAPNIARALHRSKSAVEHQASRYGISLRRRWECPACGAAVFSPLHPVTGWCAACSKAARRAELEEELRDMREEEERVRRENRARQALYSQKNRIRSKEH